ncbi:hypothetical protein I7I48_08619 [Histoplasma ohiense]|nr:hypothetical protein I7I48_08619 [Histoplasma ohiense (nom. inval.)]
MKNIIPQLPSQPEVLASPSTLPTPAFPASSSAQLSSAQLNSALSQKVRRIYLALLALSYSLLLFPGIPALYPTPASRLVSFSLLNLFVFGFSFCYLS